jgi:hypothetical protein
MTDDITTDDLFAEDAPAAEPKPKRRRAAAKLEAAAPPEPVDNAVAENHVHWECACGNTNTHSLDRCGACRTPRYTRAGA